MKSTNQELKEFVNSLEAKVVKFGNHPCGVISIDLIVLTQDICRFKTIKEWIDSKNLPKHFKKTILITLLEINPPENVKNELISLCL